MSILYSTYINAKSITKSGFTLVEMVISITISALIIGGSSYFILKTNSEAQTAKNRTQIHTEMISFMEKMNYLRGNYSTGGVLVDTVNGYDTLLLTNSGGTSGALVGIVNLDTLDINGGAKLDPAVSFSLYGNKVIGIQEITGTQIVSLLATPENAYQITFQADRYYSALQAQKFTGTTYNSGSLIEIDIGIYERHIESLRGKSTETLSNEILLPYNLVF